MNIKEIVEKYLRENGFDGLVSEDYECGCELDDLMPCSEFNSDCQPGYKYKPDPDGEYAEAEWVIGLEKPDATTD